MKRVRIRVRRSDINCARKGKCTRCPIARVLRSRFDRAFVDGTVAIVKNGGVWLRAFLGIDAIHFISRFDDHGRRGVKPTAFSFDFDIVSAESVRTRISSDVWKRL